MRIVSVVLCLLVTISALAGCASTDPTPTTVKDSPVTLKPTEEPSPSFSAATSTTSSATTTTSTTPTTTPTAPPPPVVIDPVAAGAALDSLLANAAKTYGAVGIQLAVLSRGAVIHTAEYGWAQKEEIPVTADTMYRVASLTKTVVSMVAHRLVDEGKLGLDDDISDYLGVTVRHPDYPDLPITVRMLLCHTSALRETDINVLTNPTKWRAHLTSGRAFTKDKPGTVYSYNNLAFGVLGTVCEYAAGTNFTDLAEEFFFKPMGVDATFMRGVVPKDKFGILYTSDGEVGMGMRENQGKETYFKTPGYSLFCFPGNLFISASDYAKLLWVLMNDGVYEGQRLLSSASVASIQEVQYQRGEDNFGQCLPVWRWDGHYGQSTLYCHTGNTHGMYSMYVYNPETDTAVVICTSGARGAQEAEDIFSVCSTVIRRIYEQSDLFFGTLC